MEGKALIISKLTITQANKEGRSLRGKTEEACLDNANKLGK